MAHHVGRLYLVDCIKSSFFTLIITLVWTNGQPQLTVEVSCPWKK
jgi:hypothetical protein